MLGAGAQSLPVALVGRRQPAFDSAHRSVLHAAVHGVTQAARWRAHERKTCAATRLASRGGMCCAAAHACGAVLVGPPAPVFDSAHRVLHAALHGVAQMTSWREHERKTCAVTRLGDEGGL